MNDSNPAPKTSLVKKLLIGTGVFFATILLAILVIPLVVNVDSYRPQIVEMANQHLNGKLVIGKLSLSLWGKIEIDIDGIILTDGSGEQLVAVKDTYAHISLLSFLKGQPRLIFRMDRPEIKIVKDKTGKLNLLNLLKPANPSAVPAGEAAAPAPAPAADGKKQDIPMIALIAAAGVDVDLTNAQLSFRDLSSGFSQDVKDFNLLIQDISMSRPMKVASNADIKTKVGESMNISGPFKLDGVITPQFVAAEFQKVDVSLDISLNDLVIDMNGNFKKEKGMPFLLKTNLTASGAEINVEKLMLNFHNAVIEATMRVSDMQKVSPTLDFGLVSNPIDLSSWGKLIPALKPFDLEGRMDLRAKAQGPTDKLKYEAKLDMIDLVANAPGLQVKPKMQVHVEVETDHLKKASFNLEAPGNDLAVLATVKSFSKPLVNVSLSSNGIDLDQLLPPPPPPPKEAAAPKAEEKSGGSSQSSGSQRPQPAAPATDVDQTLDPLRTNAVLRELVANIKVLVKKFKGFKVSADNVVVDFSFKQLVAAIEKFDLGIFGGQIKANASVDIKPKMPSYKMKLDVASIDMQTAIASTVESLKNTMVGKLSFSAAGNGQSLNSDKILPNLNMAGNFKIADAEFATIDVGKMVAEAINSGIQGAVAKFPPLKDQKLPTDLKSFKSKYQTVSSDFTLKNGVFLAPNFKTVSYKNNGIDLEGRTEADLSNDKLSAQWYVIDTYNITKAHDVKVDSNGVKVDHILAEKGKPVGFPIKVGCKLSAPCYDYKSVPEHFSNVAMNNSKKIVGARVEEEKKKLEVKARKELENAKKDGGKKLKKDAKDALKKLGL